MILPIFGAAFLQGLASSLHCVGMCGPFAGTLSVSSGESGWRSNAFLQVSYNLGRLGSYSLLGILFGAAGQGANFVSVELGWVREIAAWISGFFLLFFGLSLFFGGSRVSFRLSAKILEKIAKPILQSLRSGHEKPFFPPLLGFAFGLVTGLLPCGVLYPAFALAFATGSPWLGGGIMISFFLGTFPLLFLFGFGFRTLASKLVGNRARFAGIIVILIGIGWIFFRIGHDHSGHSAHIQDAHESHSSHSN